MKPDWRIIQLDEISFRLLEGFEFQTEAESRAKLARTTRQLRRHARHGQNEMVQETLNRLIGAVVLFTVCIVLVAAYAIVIAALAAGWTYVSSLLEADFNLKVAGIYFEMRMAGMMPFREFFWLMTIVGGGIVGLISALAVLVTSERARDSLPHWQRARPPYRRYAVYWRPPHNTVEVRHHIVSALSQKDALMQAKEAYTRAGIRWDNDNIVVERITLKYRLWRDWQDFKKDGRVVVIILLVLTVIMLTIYLP